MESPYSPPNGEITLACAGPAGRVKDAHDTAD
jgi:hypothetical protein